MCCRNDLFFFFLQLICLSFNNKSRTHDVPSGPSLPRVFSVQDTVHRSHIQQSLEKEHLQGEDRGTA